MKFQVFLGYILQSGSMDSTLEIGVKNYEVRLNDTQRYINRDNHTTRAIGYSFCQEMEEKKKREI